MADAMILFDIDGTLMLTGGAGSRCLRRAARTVLGEQFQWCSIASGLLDVALQSGASDPGTKCSRRR